MTDADDRACRPIGRDEMNLSEFPITLLSDRVPKGVKTLTFEDQHGTLTITGSDAYGLPTAPDADVIVGLLALTKARNDFTDPTVPFTRHEVLKLLGWADQGRQYRRLDESLNRWVGVTLYYKGLWWDNALRGRVDAKFHILDCVTVYGEDIRRTLRGRGQPVPSSTFTWSKTFFQSCQANNLKGLDLDTYRSLESAVSRQMYRFLDKRLYVREDVTFDLADLAFNHVGLSRNYTAAKVKEKLRPAIAELEAIDFIEPMPNSERYAPGGRRGEWRVRFRKARPAILEAPLPQPAGLEAELVERGVTRGVAAELVATHPEDRIRIQIQYADWTRKKAPRKIKDMGAYLAGAIRDDYAPPAGFKPHVEAAQVEPEAATARTTAARDRDEHAQVKAFWDGLSPAERERIDAEAVANTDPEVRAEIEAERSPVVRRAKLVPIRDAHLRTLLKLPIPEAG